MSIVHWELAMNVLPREDEDHTDRSWVLVGVLSIQSQVFSTVHGSAQGAAMNWWCRCLEYLGEYAEVSSHPAHGIASPWRSTHQPMMIPRKGRKRSQSTSKLDLGLSVDLLVYSESASHYEPFRDFCFPPKTLLTVTTKTILPISTQIT